MFSKFKYVYMLYKEGSFTRAAEKLFISQPSLSVAIKNIEKELDAELFERTGSGVRPTEVGKEYIAAIEKIMTVENEFKSKVHDIKYLESGQITVGGSNYLSSYVLPKIIDAFTTLYPKITVSLVEANSCNLLDLIQREQVDIIIDNLDKTDEYKGYPLAQEKILLCVPKDRAINVGLEENQIHPDRIYNGSIDIDSVACVPIETFKNEKFILLKPGNDMHHRAMDIFKKGNIEPNVAFLVDQLNISYALAETGIGLSFVTDTFFKYGRFRENVLLYNVSKECSRTLYIAHKQNKYCTRAMTEFIKVAKEVLK